MTRAFYLQSFFQQKPAPGITFYLNWNGRMDSGKTRWETRARAIFPLVIIWSFPSLLLTTAKVMQQHHIPV